MIAERAGQACLVVSRQPANPSNAPNLFSKCVKRGPRRLTASARQSRHAFVTTCRQVTPLPGPSARSLWRVAAQESVGDDVGARRALSDLSAAPTNDARRAPAA